MGWISWARFTDTVDCRSYPNDCLNEQLFKQMADRLVEDGYAKVGYNYVNMDDCWSEMNRTQEKDELVANHERFPNGIGALANYVHSKGLHFGIYGDCGTKTCAGYPAQLKTTANLEDNYFSKDAQLFAEWQLDSLKFDGCYLEPDRQELICPKMAQALAQTKRPMVLICEYPFYMLGQKLQPNWTLVEESCNVWRYFLDVEDSWLSILNIIDFTVRLQSTIIRHHGPGHWFDPDQLVIGNFGLSEDEARAQMAIWCLWSAPLYMGNDPRNMGQEMAAILKNEKLIAVDQDKLGLFGLMVSEQSNGHIQAFVKIVEPTKFGCPSFVVVYLNRDTLGNTRIVSFGLRDLLTKMPIALAGRRQSEVYKVTNEKFDPIEVDKCKLLLKSGMSRKRRQGDSQVIKPVKKEGGEEEVPVQEKQVLFEVEDLFGDSAEPEIYLNSELTLRVNPSGVRAVKLTLKQIG